MLPAGKPFLTQVVFCVKMPLLLHDKAATTKHQGTMLTRLFTHLYAPPTPHTSLMCVPTTRLWKSSPPAFLDELYLTFITVCVHTVQSLAFEFGWCTLTSLPRTVASGSLMLPIGNNRRLTHNPEAAKEQMASNVYGLSLFSSPKNFTCQNCI